MNRRLALSPQGLALLVLWAFIPLGILILFRSPIGDDTRIALIILGLAGGFYSSFSLRIIFKRSPHWRVIIPIGNTVIITVACLLVRHVMPMISVFYLVSIAAIAIQGDWRDTLGTAFLSAIGLIVSYSTQVPTPWVDVTTLIGVFIFVAVLTGKLSELAQTRMDDFEKMFQAHQRQDRAIEAERTVTLAVSRTLDLTEVLNLAIDKTLAALNWDEGAIYLANNSQTLLTLTVWRNIPSDFVTHAQMYRFGEGITGTAALERRPLVVPNVHQDPRTRVVFRDATKVHPQISVPLIVHERVVGVLNLCMPRTLHITDADVALVQAIGTSVALAIDHARWVSTLEEHVHERTQELAALNRITQVINQSLDLDAVLNTAIDELTNTLQLPGAWVRLFDAHHNTLTLRASRGIHSIPSEREPIVQVGEGICGQVALDLKARAQNLDDSDFTNRASLMKDGLQSAAAIPLIGGGEFVGVLGLASAARDRFGDSELSWLVAIGDALAIAINNARIYASVERQLRRIETLREIDRTLNSMLDLEPMLETMLDRLTHVIPHDNAIVFMRESDHLRGVVARGKHADQMRGFKFKISNPIFQCLVLHDAPMIIPDVSREPGWEHLDGDAWGKSWLGAPLIARGEPIGELSLFNFNTDVFTDEHIALLQAFADHAAITIANAHLRTELHEQAQRDSLTGALNHGAFISELHRHAAQAVQANAPLALIMLDIDNYKQYNDTYGHVFGDVVLEIVVKIIRSHIKRYDLVGRWGGEEFGIALLNADQTQAFLIAERIRQTLINTHLDGSNGKMVPAPTVSQGIAVIPDSATAVDELIDRADCALYQAKAAGRDQVVVAKK